MKPDTYIPLPVQSFLMSHTFSFLQNPSAREGICMTFEKVIVQNILHGRSIVLCEAIQSMPRWQFIRASFPHVLHCGAIMLREKLRTTFVDTQQSQKQTRAEQLQSSVDRGPLQFSQAETKLLYTLHWILLDAASECEDADLEVTQPKASITGPNKGGLLHDLASIQLFVYLFAPLIEQLKAVDFETLKLEAGLSIWVPLMANQQPLATLLSSPVKLFDFRYTPFGTQLVFGDTHRHGAEQKSAVYHGLVTKKHGIYVGEQNAVSSSGTSKPIKCNEDHDETGPMSRANEGTGKSTASEVTFANGAVDGSPIPPKATTESMDDEDDKHQSEAQVGDKLSDNPDIGFNRIQKFIIDQTEKMRSEKLQFPAGTDPVQTTSNSTALLATHFDVAVVRCLYCSEWTEPGVYWSLLYLFKRLLQVRSDWAQVKRETAKLIRMTKGRAVQHCPQKPYLFWSHMPSALLLNIRSASMPELSHTRFNRPIPSSLNQTDAAWRPDVMMHRGNSLEGNLKTVDTISSQCHPDAKPHTLAASTKGTPTPIRHPGMSDQGEEERETGIQPIRFSLGSQRLLSPDKTKISLGMKNPESRVSDASLSLTLPLVAFGGARIGTGSTNTNQPSWKNSRRSKMADIKERFSRTAKIKYTDQNSGITEGIGGDFDASPDRGNIQTFSRNGGTRCRSPAPGGNNTMWNGSRQPSLDTPHGDSDFDSLPHRNFAKATNRNSAETYLKMSENERKFTCECSTLFRSLTDSDVVYHKQEKIEEVPGAMHYITLDGQLDYSVVLRALFWRCTTYMSDRVCKQVLGCLCVLFDLGIIINHRNTRPSTRVQQKKSFKVHDKRKTYDSSKEKVNVHPAANFYSSTGKEPIQPNQFSRQTTTTSCRKDGRTVGMPSVHRKSLAAFVESGDDDPKQSLGKVDRCKAYSSREAESVGRFCSQDQFRLEDAKVLEDAAATNTRERTAGDVCRSPRRQTSRSRWSHYVQSPYQLQQPALSKQTLRSNYVLAVETVLRVIRSLGCPYGHHCSPSFGFRETPGNGERDLPTQEKDEVRRLAYDCVHHLYETDGNWFVHVISRMVATMCVPDLVELYHALTGFCSDPATRAKGHLPTDANYANSFNQAAIVSGTLEVESIIIACSLGPFIRRLVRCRVEIVSQENLSLFGDIRQLFSYLREVHGSTFRLNMLVALICPIHRVWERLRPKSAAGCSRMSSRNSMWLFPRVDKRRSSSLFTDGLVDADPAGFGAGGLRTGQRITSWHMFLPRSSVVSRGFRLSNGLGSWPTFDRDGTHGRKDLEHSGQETVVEHRWVNVSALKEGLLDFSFLLECCEPGTIPEPQLVAALFDLEAPVVARACLLMECAFLVHRCNRGEWASWTKFNVPGSFHSSHACASSGSMWGSPWSGENGTRSADHVSDEIGGKQNTGRLFHAWGVAVGSRLRYLISSMAAGPGTPNTVPVCRGQTSVEKQQDSQFRQFSALDTEENFLDDASVNMTGDSCPHVLLAMGVQLLLEITTYLREMQRRVPPFGLNERPQQHYPSTGRTSRRRSREHSHERSGSLLKNSASSFSGPGTSFKAARRRLSILMPIFGSGGSVNAGDADEDIEEIASAAKSLSPRRNLASRRISFAVFSDSKDARGSLVGSVGSLDHSPDSEKPALNKRLLRHHRGSGSFKRLEPNAQESLGVYFHQKALPSLEQKLCKGGALVAPGVAGENSPANLSDEQSDCENLHSAATTSSRSLAASRYSRPKSQSTTIRTRLEENTLPHGSVRRSVSAALAGRRQRTSSVLKSCGSIAEGTATEQDAFSAQMPWIDAVIEFANYTNFNCEHYPHCLPNCFERQQYQFRALMKAIGQVYGAETERSFIKSIDRQLCARPANTSPKFGEAEAKSLVPDGEQTDNSSASNTSLRIGSSGGLYNSDLEASRSTATGGIYGGTDLHPTLYHDNVSGTAKTSDNELDLLTSLQRRAESAAPLERPKTKYGIFSRSAKRKELHFLGHNNKGESTPLLEKLRLRVRNRQRNNGVSDPETAGLSSLLGLGVLAGAGAGLLRTSLSGVGLCGNYTDTDDYGSPDPARTDSRRVYRNLSNPELPIQRYLQNQVKNLCGTSFNLLCKAALLLSNEQLSKVVPLAWELLLEPDEELVSSASSLILFCAVKASSLVQELILAELQHESPSHRVSAILRFRALWTHRYHVWSHLEEGAPTQLRVPPPSIEYVLPSPTLGYPGYEVPDPAWQIRKGTSAEEVQLKQNEATKTFVTASTSRRKQQQELLARAIAAETMRRRDDRRRFHLTTCSVLERAAIEPAFSKEHRDDGLQDDATNSVMSTVANLAGGTTVAGNPSASNTMQEEFTAAVRRMSMAPINRNLSNQTRSSSWRQGSMPWCRSSASNHDEEDRRYAALPALFPAQALQPAQHIFPSTLCAATIPLIHLLDDAAVGEQGTAVNSVAEYCVFNCLLEDTSLFLRFIFERLTRTNYKNELIFVLRKMLQRLPELPMQSAHAIFNNLVGYIMFHVRTPNAEAPEAIAGALAILHLVVPHVQNVYFKDLKQTLRREQIDSTLLLTANLPSAKQFNVFDNDIGVAQLVRLQDESKDYQFEDILKDVLEISGVSTDQSHNYFLFDDKSNIIRNPSHYVRDFYPFKRNHNPKLRLRQMNRHEGLRLLQHNAQTLKLQEIGKVLFTTAVLRNTPNSQISNHVFFLLEELTKLPAFPRKALESEFPLYDLASLGRPLHGLDTMHKLSWCRLLHSLFTQMPITYPWSNDLQLFLNVFNGTLILHAEDSSVLRQCLAFFIQCCNRFKMTFSTSGYNGILPTMLRVYNRQMYNSVLTQAIEYTCRQFYVMHRAPFILQLFGSLANYVVIQDEPEETDKDFYRIQAIALYRLLRAIHRPVPDNLRILELCNVQKPLKALDFCYEDEDANWSVIVAINLCVAVIVYAPDSYRARQMLVILRALLPLILRDLPGICAEENYGTDVKKAEILAIQKLAINIRQLIATTEFMTRRAEDTHTLSAYPPGGPSERRQEYLTGRITQSLTRSTLTAAKKRNSKPASEVAFSGPFGPGARDRAAVEWSDMNKSEPSSRATSSARAYSEPKETILQLSCDFLSVCSNRLVELGEKQKVPELLDPKSHLRLSEIVQSMIKQLPANPDLLFRSSLQRYFFEVLPLVEWGHESMRSSKALESLLCRLNRTLPKLLEHCFSKPRIYGDGIVRLIRSIYTVIKKHRVIAQLKEIRVLIDVLKKAVIHDPAGCLPALPSSRSDTHSAHFGWPAPQYRQSVGDSLVVGNSPDSSSFETSGISRVAGKSKLPSGTTRAYTPFPLEEVCHVDDSRTRSKNATHSFRFSAEVIRLISLVLQVLGPNFCLKDLCERPSPDYSSRCLTLLEGGYHSLATYLGQLIIPLLFRCCSGRKDSPTLSKENVFYALDVCIAAVFSPPTSAHLAAQTTGAETISTHAAHAASDEVTERGIEKLNRYASEPTSQGGRNLSISDLGFTPDEAKSISTPGLDLDVSGELSSCLSRLLSPTLTFLSSKEPVASAQATLHPNSVLVKHSTQPEGNNMKARHSISSASTHKTQSRHTDSSVARTPQIKYQAENFKTEFTHRLGFLGLKLILVGYNRHASVRLRVIIGTLTKLALNGQSGIQLWKFFDFLVTHRPPVFIHMLPFIRFKMAHLKCATPGEQAYQQIVSQKLIGLHHPVPQTTSSVLRDLMRELSAIQHDVQHFSQTRTKKSVTNTETKRRPNSVDRQYSIKKQTSRRNKLTLEEVPEHGVESERALKDKEQLANVQRIDVLASVTSESTCSVDALGEISIGLPSLSQSTRATRGVLQNFRQSILVRDPRKRIAAQEGSRMLLQSQTLKQRDPIMTASTESVNRPSRPLRKRKDRDRPPKTTSDEAHVTRMLDESYFPGLSDRFDDSGSSDETQMTVGPAAAAAIATSLYGSEAPYLHARERARQELKALVGIPMPQVDMSTESLDSHSLDKSSTCECLTAIDTTDPTHLSAITPWDNTSSVQQSELTHTETENDASNRLPLQSRINYV